MEIENTKARSPPGTAAVTKGGIHRKPLTNYAKISHKEKEEVMKKLILSTALMAMVILALGCSEENNYPANPSGKPSEDADQKTVVSYLFEKNLEYGTVRVISCSLDSLDDMATVRLEFEDQWGEVHERILEIDHIFDPELAFAVSFRLLDISEFELWRTDIAFDNVQPLRLKLFEATPSEVLTLNISRNVESTTETLQFNDRNYYFEYTTEEFEKLKLLLRTPSRVYSKGTGPTPDERVANLYDDAVTLRNALLEVPTLFDNPNGTIMISVLTDYDFLVWLIPELNPDVQPSDLTIEELCGISGAVTTIKCVLGGPSNPVCIIGSGIGLACAGYTLISWLYD